MYVVVVVVVTLSWRCWVMGVDQTLPFNGRRYSLVYFTHQRYHAANLSDQNFVVQEMAFAWPPKGLTKKSYAPPWTRLSEGKKAFAHWRECELAGKETEYEWPIEASIAPSTR